MDKMREEFERWALAKGWFLGRDGDVYRNTYVGVAFEAWQASRAALVVELPEIVWEDAQDYKNRITKALDEAGIKYE